MGSDRCEENEEVVTDAAIEAPFPVRQGVHGVSLSAAAPLLLARQWLEEDVAECSLEPRII